MRHQFAQHGCGFSHDGDKDFFGELAVARRKNAADVLKERGNARDSGRRLLL